MSSSDECKYKFTENKQCVPGCDSTGCKYPDESESNEGCCTTPPPDSGNVGCCDATNTSRNDSAGGNSGHEEMITNLMNNVFSSLIGAKAPELTRMKTIDVNSEESDSSDGGSMFSETSSEDEDGSMFDFRALDVEERRQYNIQLLLLSHCELVKAVCK